MYLSFSDKELKKDENMPLEFVKCYQGRYKD
jgi:hypothetical protein